MRRCRPANRRSDACPRCLPENELRHPTRDRVWDSVSGRFPAHDLIECCVQHHQRPGDIDACRIAIAAEYESAITAVNAFVYELPLARKLPTIRTPLRRLQFFGGRFEVPDIIRIRWTRLKSLCRELCSHFACSELPCILTPEVKGVIESSEFDCCCDRRRRGYHRYRRPHPMDWRTVRWYRCRLDSLGCCYRQGWSQSRLT
jgi:hypothetical protein